MSDSQDIRRALEGRLNGGSYTGITNSTDIAWENVQFNPTGKSAWLRPKLSITEIIPATADSTGTEKWTGVFYVDAFVKENTGGTAVLDDLADDVKARFTKGLQITENSEIINIRYSQRYGFVNDSPWIFCPLAFTFYAYITP